jgi:hypothetical protein
MADEGGDQLDFAEPRLGHRDLAKAGREMMG